MGLDQYFPDAFYILVINDRKKILNQYHLAQAST